MPSNPYCRLSQLSLHPKRLYPKLLVSQWLAPHPPLNPSDSLHFSAWEFSIWSHDCSAWEWLYVAPCGHCCDMEGLQCYEAFGLSHSVYLVVMLESPHLQVDGGWLLLTLLLIFSITACWCLPLVNTWESEASPGHGACHSLDRGLACLCILMSGASLHCDNSNSSSFIREWDRG